MPLFALAIGILFIATGLNNTTGQMFSLLGKEFSGSDNKPSFIPLLISILVIGSLGYYEKIQRLANMFLLLVMVVLVLVNRGVFDEFSKAFKLANGGKGIVPSNTSEGSVFSDNPFSGSALTGGIGNLLGKTGIGDVLNKVDTTINQGRSIYEGVNNARIELKNIFDPQDGGLKGLF